MMITIIAFVPLGMARKVPTKNFTTRKIEEMMETKRASYSPDSKALYILQIWE